MLKTCLKNFFKNLLYLFIPMGILYLFLILFTYGFLFATVKDLGTMLRDIYDLVEKSVESSGAEIQDFIAYAEGQIDWSAGFMSILRQIADTRWIQNTVSGFFETLDISVAGFSDAIGKIIHTFTDSVKTNFVITVFMLFLGLITANVVTGYVLRRKTAKRTIKQFVVNQLLNPVFNAAVGIALLWASAVIKGYALLLLVVIALLYVTLSLLFAWVVYKDENLKLKQVVNIKNVLECIGAACVIIAIDLVFFLLACLVNVAVAVLLLLPLIVYSSKIIDYNAAGYILEIQRA